MLTRQHLPNVMALFALTLAAGCGGATDDTATPSEDSSTSVGSTTTTEPTTEPTPEPTPEPVVMNPDANYSHSCDYVLGDFSENSRTGYRFIGDAQMKNTGNIGVDVEVRAVWFLSGGDKVTAEKSTQLEVGQRKRIGFSVPATGDQIDLHQSLTSGQTCSVKATLVDTFGEVQE